MSAFSECRILTKIVITHLNITIDYYAFCRCVSLKELVIPENMNIGYLCCDDKYIITRK